MPGGHKIRVACRFRGLHLRRHLGALSNLVHCQSLNQGSCVIPAQAGMTEISNSRKSQITRLRISHGFRILPRSFQKMLREWSNDGVTERVTTSMRRFMRSIAGDRFQDCSAVGSICPIRVVFRFPIELGLVLIFKWEGVS